MCKLAYEVKSHRKVRPFAKDWINLGGDLLKAFVIVLEFPVVICVIPATLYSRIATKSGMGAISPRVPPAQAGVLLWEVPLWKHFKSFKWQLCLPVALTVEIKCSTELICQTNLTWKPHVMWLFCLFCGSAAVKILQRVFFLKSLYDPQRESTTWLFFFLSFPLSMVGPSRQCGYCPTLSVLEASLRVTCCLFVGIWDFF